MTRKRWILLILIIAVLAIIGKAYYDTNVFRTVDVTFTTDELPAGTSIRILQISDVHNKQFGGNNKRLIDAADNANPDMIVVTGDLIDRDTSDINPMLDLMEALSDVTEQIYFVTGNHEWDNPYTEDIIEGIKARGIPILNNKNTQVEVNGAVVNLAGIADHYTGHHDLNKAFEGISREYYTILLSHAPLVIQNDQAASADLILSGHTHGGQIRFPFVGGVIAPGEELFPKYDKGTFEFAPNSYLYIDAGLGTSILPIRFMNQSQMTMVTVKGEG